MPLTAAPKRSGAGATGTPELLTIGDAARRLGTTTRTLRYYESLGLLRPAARTSGGARRFVPADVERVEHIRELQVVLGFDLEEIRQMLAAEDRIEELRTEYEDGVSVERVGAMLHECTAINTRLQDLVAQKVALLDDALAELRAKARRYATVAAEYGIVLQPAPRSRVRRARS